MYLRSNRHSATKPLSIASFFLNTLTLSLKKNKQTCLYQLNCEQLKLKISKLYVNS